MHVRPRREDVSSAIIQGTGAAASAGGLAFLLARAWPSQDAVALWAIGIYGVSMIFAFLASALYHGIHHGRVKQILQQLDHCTIFLLIAGTYTPIALMPLRHHSGVCLLAAIWTLATSGVVLRLWYGAAYRRIAVALYVFMGWLAAAWGLAIYRTIGAIPIGYMFAGGLSYTGGLLFYRWRQLPFSNPAWHLCVIAGSACFFAAIAHII